MDGVPSKLHVRPTGNGQQTAIIGDQTWRDVKIGRTVLYRVSIALRNQESGEYSNKEFSYLL